MANEPKQALRLRDEFFDELINGRPTVEAEKDQEQVLLKDGEEEKNTSKDDKNE